MLFEVAILCFLRNNINTFVESYLDYLNSEKEIRTNQKTNT
jgi:hypothetical protein